MSIFDTTQAMDPKRGECVGHYLYGAGYYAREDQQLGILRGERTEASFCQGCALKKRCEEESAARVRAQDPEAVEAFDREVSVAKERGFTRLMVQAARMRAANPDPFMAACLKHYHRGVQDRQRVAV